MTSDDYNQACAEKLKQLRFEDYVAVVGSGLSHDIAADLDDLIKIMERNCGVFREKSESSTEPHWLYFNRVFSTKPELYFDTIKESFTKTRPFDGHAYKQIVKISFKSFVTLNYDELLPRTFAEMTHDRKVDCLFSIYPGENPIFLPSDFSAKKPCLVAVHGCKSSDANWHKNLILCESDYNKYYCGDIKSQPPFLYIWWYWLLTTCPCVFIGTSLREPGLRIVIDTILERSNESLKNLKHIHLVGIKRNPTSPYYPEQSEKSFGVFDKVCYDQIDNDHSGLVKVLSQITGSSETIPIVTKLRRPISIGNSNDWK